MWAPLAESRLPVGSSARTMGAQNEGPSERDTLLLAAGELDRVVVETVGEADTFEQGEGTGHAVGFIVGVEFVGEQNVFERGERGDELVGLEDEADGAATYLGEFIFGEVGDGGAVDEDVAGGWGVETSE